MQHLCDQEQHASRHHFILLLFISLVLGSTLAISLRSPSSSAIIFQLSSDLPSVFQSHTSVRHLTRASTTIAVVVPRSGVAGASAITSTGPQVLSHGLGTQLRAGPVETQMGHTAMLAEISWLTTTVLTVLIYAAVLFLAVMMVPVLFATVAVIFQGVSKNEADDEAQPVVGRQGASQKETLPRPSPPKLDPVKLQPLDSLVEVPSTPTPATTSLESSAVEMHQTPPAAPSHPEIPLAQVEDIEVQEDEAAAMAPAKAKVAEELAELRQRQNAIDEYFKAQAEAAAMAPVKAKVAEELAELRQRQNAIDEYFKAQAETIQVVDSIIVPTAAGVIDGSSRPTSPKRGFGSPKKPKKSKR